MKKIILVIVITFSFGVLETHAQTWSEWFKQKKTQRQYHARQIALLKVYLEYVKKGVSVVRSGLRTIENVKNGDFNLHRDFFSSLKQVNPHISNSAKVADIIAFQVFIVRSLKNVNDFCKNNENFTAEEIRYVADVYANMLVLTDASIDELMDIIKPDRTVMTDDERLLRVDKLYDETLDRHAFAKAFDNEARLLEREREKERRNIQLLRGTYGMTEL
jgi:hypothetical protein